MDLKSRAETMILVTLVVMFLTDDVFSVQEGVDWPCGYTSIACDNLNRWEIGPCEDIYFVCKSTDQGMKWLMKFCTVGQQGMCRTVTYQASFLEDFECMNFCGLDPLTQMPPITSLPTTTHTPRTTGNPTTTALPTTRSPTTITTLPTRARPSITSLPATTTRHTTTPPTTITRTAANTPSITPYSTDIIPTRSTYRRTSSPGYRSTTPSDRNTIKASTTTKSMLLSTTTLSTNNVTDFNYSNLSTGGNGIISSTSATANKDVSTITESTTTTLKLRTTSRATTTTTTETKIIEDTDVIPQEFVHTTQGNAVPSNITVTDVKAADKKDTNITIFRSTGLIIGCVLGGFFLLVLLFIAVIYAKNSKLHIRCNDAKSTPDIADMVRNRRPEDSPMGYYIDSSVLTVPPRRAVMSGDKSQTYMYEVPSRGSVGSANSYQVLLSDNSLYDPSTGEPVYSVMEEKNPSARSHENPRDSLQSFIYLGGPTSSENNDYTDINSVSGISSSAYSRGDAPYRGVSSFKSDSPAPGRPHNVASSFRSNPSRQIHNSTSLKSNSSRISKNGPSFRGHSLRSQIRESSIKEVSRPYDGITTFKGTKPEYLEIIEDPEHVGVASDDHDYFVLENPEEMLQCTNDSDIIPDYYELENPNE